MPLTELAEFTVEGQAPGRPPESYSTLWNELLGTEVRTVHGQRWRHRVIMAGSPDSPPLLLLHGLGGHAECWARNIVSLAEDFYVVAADMVFHGYSGTGGWDAERWVEIMADGVVDLLDGLGLESCFIEGESLGAHVGFNLGLRYPDRLRRIVLNTGLPLVRVPGEPAPITRPGGTSNALLESSQQVTVKPSFEAMRERMRWLVSHPDRMTDEAVETRLRLYQVPETNASMRRLYGVDGEVPRLKSYTVEEMQEFEIPALVFWTEHNPGRSWTDSMSTASHIGTARYYVMADAGHWPQWENPVEHDRVVTEFFLEARETKC